MNSDEIDKLTEENDRIALERILNSADSEEDALSVDSGILSGRLNDRSTLKDILEDEDDLAPMKSPIKPRKFLATPRKKERGLRKRSSNNLSGMFNPLKPSESNMRKSRTGFVKATVGIGRKNENPEDKEKLPVEEEKIIHKIPVEQETKFVERKRVKTAREISNLSGLNVIIYLLGKPFLFQLIQLFSLARQGFSGRR